MLRCISHRNVIYKLTCAIAKANLNAQSLRQGGGVNTGIYIVYPALYIIRNMLTQQYWIGQPSTAAAAVTKSLRPSKAANCSLLTNNLLESITIIFC